MQVHADLKGKVAADDITLWAKRCTNIHENTISNFHLTAHYVSGVNFSDTRRNLAYF